MKYIDMKVFLGGISLLMVLLILAFCTLFQNKNMNDGILMDERIIDKRSIFDKSVVHQIEVDSLLLTYNCSYDASCYDFKYSNGEIHILRAFPNVPFERHVSDRETIDKFMHYINVLFLTESEAIIESRKKRVAPIVSDYSSISLKLFVKKQPFKEMTIAIGEEGYDIEYNPIFLAFYEFLHSLIFSSESIINRQM